MLSAQVLQNTIEGLKNITRREFSVTQREGKIIAGTEADKPEFEIGAQIDAAADLVRGAAESQLVQGYQYFKVIGSGTAEYVLLIKGEDEEAYRIGKMAAFQIQGLIAAYKERLDHDNFIKNLLLDNLLTVDIYSRAEILGLESLLPREVYVIEFEAKKGEKAACLDKIREVFALNSKEFVACPEDGHAVLIKEQSNFEIESQFQKLCAVLANKICCPIRLGIGTAAHDLKHISRAYKEAKIALQVGRIFDNKSQIMDYKTLGIGRLIHQLPASLCRLFLDEVLGDTPIDAIDGETLATVDKFFENNLNVSETARQLYIHRNTLVYRLDKLQKLTGLDLRRFDDAVAFKIMLMVAKAMESRDRDVFLR